MKKHLLISAVFLGLLVSCLFLWSFSCPAATYYVRTDGGTATQCTGQSDAPYPGAGTNQPCAWSHPFWALDAAGIWKIAGGDTLLIHPGSYRMGFGAPNTDWCDAGGPLTATFRRSLPVRTLLTRRASWGWVGIKNAPIHPNCGGRKDPGRS